MGELSAETLKSKGIKGCVVDGFVRDVNFLFAIGFQAWSRGSTLRDIVATGSRPRTMRRLRSPTSQSLPATIWLATAMA